ncbi:MAG: hypothetical protein GF332_02375 [Candidatus Moranbacteria bacterium]|nr:hypothetical protein [Candidatus Moranbacteria bacterium]
MLFQVNKHSLWFKTTCVLIFVVFFLLILFYSAQGAVCSNSDSDSKPNNQNQEYQCRFYVDDDATGIMDGSSQNPFQKISHALKQADRFCNCKKVYIRSGYYQENNLRIKEGVHVSGSGANEVIIDGNNNYENVIIMDHKTKLHHVTVKGGKNGIKVKSKSRVLLWDVIVRDNNRDGVNVKESEDIKDKYQVSIHKSKLINNNWNGLYAEKSKFYIEDTLIRDNRRDGAEVRPGSKGTFKDIGFKDNQGLGLRLTIDNSKIFIKDCTFRDNEKSGLEVRYREKKGYIKIEDQTKFYENNRYGIVRLIENELKQHQWEWYFKVSDSTKFRDNDQGNQSHLIEL